MFTKRTCSQCKWKMGAKRLNSLVKYNWLTNKFDSFAVLGVKWREIDEKTFGLQVFSIHIPKPKNQASHCYYLKFCLVFSVPFFLALLILWSYTSTLIILCIKSEIKNASYTLELHWFVRLRLKASSILAETLWTLKHED